ncbi:hypothetical protein DFJ74DRAFT_704087 [Hyaloraphidium curvatum]|nr:hypothetical protein DFJ74DRAFT_704087 [Hyaloraphidium curvatum]
MTALSVSAAPEKLRRLLRASLLSLPPTRAVLLSGGLDTSALVTLVMDDPELRALHPLEDAVTIGTADCRDIPAAAKIAARYGLRHHVIPLDAEEVLSSEEESPLHVAVRALRTFDPMELRNAACVAACLLRAKELGIPRVITGDGADELFAGYSFLLGMEPDRMRAYMERMWKTMRFSAKDLGEAIGVGVLQPFLHPDVLQFARTLEHKDLVGTGPDGERTGKMALRLAVLTCDSAWRKKEPRRMCEKRRSGTAW